MAASARYSRQASAPRPGPSMAPASIAPSVCSVIGTGMPGSGIGGIRLSTTITAANTATTTTCAFLA